MAELSARGRVPPGRPTRWLLAILVAGLLVASAAPPAPPSSIVRKPIRLPALQQAAYVEALLDADVYREATAGLTDLRVRDGSGTEVAHVLRRHEKPATRTEREVPLTDLQRTERGEVRFVLDLGSRPGLHNRVRIRIDDTLRNFRVPVAVETSEDGRAWHLVRLAGFIYAVEGETRARDTAVSYPPSRARYLRVSILSPAPPLFPVTGATVIADTPAVRSEEAVPAQLAEHREDGSRKATVLLLDLGGRRPVDRIELEVADRTFHRVVVIEGSPDRLAWHQVASGAVSAVETARTRERHAGIAFAETPARWIRLTIQNGDDRPLRVGGVRLFAVRRGVVFQAVSGQTYTLDYGDPSRPAPRYDLARTFPYVEVETIPVAGLGPPTRVTLPPPRPRPWTEDRPLLVWGAMGIAGVALAGMLIRLARGVRPAPRDTGAPTE
jgi:hypothetical protein